MSLLHGVTKEFNDDIVSYWRMGIPMESVLGWMVRAGHKLPGGTDLTLAFVEQYLVDIGCRRGEMTEAGLLRKARLDAHTDRPIPRIVLNWMFGDDAGSSSKAIVFNYYDIKTRDNWSYPFDSSDFGRCYRMLKLFPWMGLEHMTQVNGVWVLLVARWPELVRLYEAAEAMGWQHATSKEIKAACPGIKEYGRNGLNTTKAWKEAEEQITRAKRRMQWGPFCELLDSCRRDADDRKILKKHNVIVLGDTVYAKNPGS